MLKWLGKAEGVISVNLGIFISLCGLVAGKVITGTEFVSCFTAWISLFMGATALAGFRDWNKNGGNGNGATAPAPK